MNKDLAQPHALPYVNNKTTGAAEGSESTLNGVLCADCGAQLMEHEGIIKSETVFLDIVYEGEPICEPCLDARCLTARENAST